MRKIIGLLTIVILSMSCVTAELNDKEREMLTNDNFEYKMTLAKGELPPQFELREVLKDGWFIYEFRVQYFLYGDFSITDQCVLIPLYNYDPVSKVIYKNSGFIDDKITLQEK